MKTITLLFLFLALFLTPPVFAGHGIQTGATIVGQIAGDVDLTGVVAVIGEETYSVDSAGRFIALGLPSGSVEIGLQLPESLEMVGEVQTVELQEGAQVQVNLEVAEKRGISAEIFLQQNLRLLAVLAVLFYIGWRLRRLNWLLNPPNSVARSRRV